MDDQLVAKIAAEYGLPNLVYEGAVAAGYLSQNHILVNGSERFFCKRYRFEGELNKVSIIHRAKFHFAEHGIPAILPLPTLSGRTFFAVENRCFALFPFVDGLKSKQGEMTRVTAESAGMMLAKIHKTGQNILDIAPSTAKANFDATPFWEKTARIVEILEAKESLTEFDELAYESLRLKRELAAQNPPRFHELGLSDDHLVHGDFQSANFFVDGSGQVTHVYDWELTKVTAREVALLRSVLFSCLQKGDDFRPLFTDETFTQAEWYLESYQSVYPLNVELLVAAIQSRHLGDIYSTWIEAEHYLKDNNRVDLFLPGAVDRLREPALEREAFAARICGMVR